MEVELLLGDRPLLLIGGGGGGVVHGGDGAEDERRKIKNARGEDLRQLPRRCRAVGAEARRRREGVDRHEAVLEAVTPLVELEPLLLLAGALDGGDASASASAAAAPPCGGGIWAVGGVLSGVGGAGEHLHHLLEGGGVGLDEGGGVGAAVGVRSGYGGFRGGGVGWGGGAEVEGGAIAAAGGAAIAVWGVRRRWMVFPLRRPRR